MNNKIILGTVQFGLDYGINNTTGKPSKKEIFNILELAYSEGISILDTADAYGDATSIIGEYHDIYPNKKFKINTKFKGNSDNIRKHVLTTIDKLRVDKLNVYFYHNFSDYINNSSIKDTLLSLKKEGLIDKIGLSVYGNDELKIAINSPLIDVIQLPYNLLDNDTIRGKYIEQAKLKKKEIQARSVFLQGLFFKDTRTLDDKLKPLESNLMKIREIASSNNLSIAKLALNYVINNTLIDNVIIGVDSIIQLQENLNSIDKEIDNEKLSKEINTLVVDDINLLFPKNW